MFSTAEGKDPLPRAELGSSRASGVTSRPCGDVNEVFSVMPRCAEHRLAVSRRRRAASLVAQVSFL